MKKGIVFGLGGLVGLCAAQEIPGLADLPECGQFCINAMQGSTIAEQLGCNQGDLGCLCRQQDFIYGVRDCSFQSCFGEGEADSVLSFGYSLCANNGVVISTIAHSTATATATTTVSGSIDEEDSNLTTFVSGGSTFTSTIAASATGDAGEDEDASATTDVSVTLSGSTLVSETPDTTSGRTQTQTETETETGDAATSTPSADGDAEEDDDSSAHLNAVPAAGLLAIAGVAVLLL